MTIWKVIRNIYIFFKNCWGLFFRLQCEQWNNYIYITMTLQTMWICLILDHHWNDMRKKKLWITQPAECSQPQHDIVLFILNPSSSAHCCKVGEHEASRNTLIWCKRRSEDMVSSCFKYCTQNICYTISTEGISLNRIDLQAETRLNWNSWLKY